MKQKIDPYRFFFPLGLFLGAWGVSYWIFFVLKLSQSYPSSSHASVMIGGFLFLFATGFLMTAIPAFTRTPKASLKEIGVMFAVGLALVFSVLIESSTLFHRFLLIEMVLLFLYGGRRVLKRKDDPPPSFLFVGAGLLFGFIGTAIFCLQDLGLVSPTWFGLGRNIFFQGMMLCLVLGVGSRLIPALMGWDELPNVKREESPEDIRRDFIWMSALIIVVVLSFFVENFMEIQMGRSLRALATTIIAIKYWKLLKRPPEKSWLSRWLWASGWCVVLGLWGYALSIPYGIHFIHITFIGGFSLMTIMIATRVTLAHGNHGFELEETSKALMWSGIFLLLAALTRLVAPFTGAGYMTHLGYASLVWIIGIIIWSLVFLKKIFFLSKNGTHQC